MRLLLCNVCERCARVDWLWERNLPSCGSPCSVFALETPIPDSGGERKSRQYSSRSRWGGFSRIQHPSLPPSQSCPSCPASADPTLPPVSQLTPRSWLLSQSRAVRSVTDPPRCPSEGQRISACVGGKWGINQSLQLTETPNLTQPISLPQYSINSFCTKHTLARTLQLNAVWVIKNESLMSHIPSSFSPTLFTTGFIKLYQTVPEEDVSLSTITLPLFYPCVIVCIV